MMEDFTKYALKKKAATTGQVSVYLMGVMPVLMHPGFVGQKTRDAIVKSLRGILG